MQTISTLAEILYPVIPFTCEKIFKMLNTEKTEWNFCGKDNLTTGHKLNEPEILFTKIEDETIEKQVNKLGVLEVKEEAEEKIPLISFEDFSKVQLRVAQIIEAEKIKKSTKLLKLQVDLGNEKRQVVAGIAKSYSPEDLKGKRIVLVANLQPAKLFGEESQGMILAVEDSEGTLNVLETNEKVKLGTQVK